MALPRTPNYCEQMYKVLIDTIGIKSGAVGVMVLNTILDEVIDHEIVTEFYEEGGATYGDWLRDMMADCQRRLAYKTEVDGVMVSLSLKES